MNVVNTKHNLKKKIRKSQKKFLATTLKKFFFPSIIPKKMNF